MRTLTLYMLAFLLLSASCKKNQTECYTLDQLPEELVGQWDMVSSFNPWTNETTTPAQSGQYETLVFMNNDSVRITNNYQTVTTAYQLVVASTSPLVYNLEYGSYTTSNIRFNCDKLVIDDTPVDGPRKEYKKVD